MQEMKKIPSVTISAIEKQRHIETLTDFHSQFHLKLKDFMDEAYKKRLDDNTVALVNDIFHNLKQQYSQINPDAELLKISVRRDPKDVCAIKIEWGEYAHDCHDCLYLGTYNEKDMYFCQGTGSLILRNGPEGEDYESLPGDAVIDIMKNGTYSEKDEIMRFIRVYEIYKRHCPQVETEPRQPLITNGSMKE